MAKECRRVLVDAAWVMPAFAMARRMARCRDCSCLWERCARPVLGSMPREWEGSTQNQSHASLKVGSSRLNPCGILTPATSCRLSSCQSLCDLCTCSRKAGIKERGNGTTRSRFPRTSWMEISAVSKSTSLMRKRMHFAQGVEQQGDRVSGIFMRKIERHRVHGVPAMSKGMGLSRTILGLAQRSVRAGPVKAWAALCRGLRLF